MNDKLMMIDRRRQFLGWIKRTYQLNGFVFNLVVSTEAERDRYEALNSQMMYRHYVLENHAGRAANKAMESFADVSVELKFGFTKMLTELGNQVRGIIPLTNKKVRIIYKRLED
jgi:hypothetical protein